MLEEVRRVEQEALEEYERIPDEYRILYEQYRQEHVSRAQRRLDAESHAAGSSSGPEASAVRVFGCLGVWRSRRSLRTPSLVQMTHSLGLFPSGGMVVSDHIGPLI
jgi:hypothetical protein